MKILNGLITTFVAGMAILGLVAGCGGGGQSKVSVDDAVTVSGFRVNVASVVLDGSEYGQLLDSMDEVIAIARRDPDAVYAVGDEPGVTMRQVLADAASDLQPYQPDLAAKLDRAVQTLE